MYDVRVFDAIGLRLFEARCASVVAEGEGRIAEGSDWVLGTGEAIDD